MIDETIKPVVPATSEGHLSYRMVYGAMALVILGIDIFTQPTRYADLDTYVYYLDALVHYPPDSWMYFEVLSNIYLLVSHWLMQSVFLAVILAHYVLGLVFLALLGTAFPARSSSWPTLLFMFAILGPLLAFVTMRATPAYFLVAIAVRYAIDRRISAWLFLVLAAMFHISALLAAVPLGLLYFERNLPGMLRSNRSRKLYLFITLTVIAFGAILPELSSGVTSVIKSIPVISKYDVYTESIATETRIGHYIFLLFVSVLTIIFLMARDELSAKLSVYVMASFALYVVMFFSASPVAAFRQTPFWVMPMIALLPWKKVGLTKATAPLFVIACAVLFVFQFGQVYG
jgi:hypothetical protein